MFSKANTDLKRLSQQIDQDFKAPSIDAPNLNRIAIKIIHFRNKLQSDEKFFVSEDANENIKRREMYNAFKTKGDDFLTKAEDLKYAIQEAIVNERYGCNNDVVDEINENDGEDNIFMRRNTNRINEYIFSAIDSIEQLKNQRDYINNTRERIRSGLCNIGISQQLVDKICSRYLSDYGLFSAGVGIVILLILLIKYVL